MMMTEKLENHKEECCLNYDERVQQIKNTIDTLNIAQEISQ